MREITLKYVKKKNEIYSRKMKLNKSKKVEIYEISKY